MSDEKIFFTIKSVKLENGFFSDEEIISYIDLVNDSDFEIAEKVYDMLNDRAPEYIRIESTIEIDSIIHRIIFVDNDGEDKKVNKLLDLREALLSLTTDEVFMLSGYTTSDFAYLFEEDNIEDDSDYQLLMDIIHDIKHDHNKRLIVIRDNLFIDYTSVHEAIGKAAIERYKETGYISISPIQFYQFVDLEKLGKFAKSNKEIFNALKSIFKERFNDEYSISVIGVAKDEYEFLGEFFICEFEKLSNRIKFVTKETLIDFIDLVYFSEYLETEGYIKRIRLLFDNRDVIESFVQIKPSLFLRNSR